jgi:hypothetical protein
MNLYDIVEQSKADPESINDPVNRMFICDGESVLFKEPVYSDFLVN